MLYQIGGGGLPKDSVQADMWFSLSDKSDSEHQNTNVRQRLEESMSQKDIVEAQRRAVLWKPKPAAE
jgi:hypothetical protein